MVLEAARVKQTSPCSIWNIASGLSWLGQGYHLFDHRAIDSCPPGHGPINDELTDLIWNSIHPAQSMHDGDALVDATQEGKKACDASSNAASPS